MKQPSPRRGGRPALLTSERVVAAAVEVLDGEGLDALTMRGVGARLGVAAMSLYRHVPNRDVFEAGLHTMISGFEHDLGQASVPG